jgi:hypothetical protein
MTPATLRYGAAVVLDELFVPADRFAAETGWEPKPEGLCRGELCVPAPDALRDGDVVDVRAAAARLGMPLVEDPHRGLWAVGPATLGGRALDTAVCPELVLRDRHGKDVALTSLRGRKAIMVAWASW